MKISFPLISKWFAPLVLALAVSLAGEPAPAVSAPLPSPVRMAGHVPTKAVAAASLVGPLPATADISLTFVLPLQNPAALHTLLERIYDPTDPLYGRYLTPEEFTDRFGPTQEDYDALAAYAKGLGLTVTGIHPNRTLLNASGPARIVEAAFNLHLRHYETQDGRQFHAPDNDPEVPDIIASRIAGIVGLDNYTVRRTYRRIMPATETARISPLKTGSGPGGSMTPGDIVTAYNLQGVAPTGSGQTIALFELDGYTASDVAVYASTFGLPSIPLQNVLVDGFSGAPGDGAIEVTLDIELQMALAPGASKIIVYEGPNTDTGVLDTYNRIATDNLARQVSTSWGAPEVQSSTPVLYSENTIFQQMAAQGQSIFAASGDSGAYDNYPSKELSVDDPASQPFMVGVGGTRLYVNGDMTYNRESTWNDGKKKGAGGGGVSSVWSIPTWQQGVSTAASMTMRNVPDVALNADYLHSGYATYFQGHWYAVGGTSCGSPLWAAFAARVNEMLTANGLPVLGFANPQLYRLATGLRYGTDFHDIADNSSNLFYKAVTGYDNATGWGSFNGDNLLSHLAGKLPDLTVAMSHAGNFTQGMTGAIYTVTAGNSGNAPTTGTVTVTGNLPSSLKATALMGTGWICKKSTLTCTRSDVLAAGESYPPITLTVKVAGTAPSSVISSATVSGGGEINTGNDTDSDPTTILAR